MTDLRLYVLLALGDGPAHGYAIGKAIEALSHGRLDPTTGALYQALKHLSEDALVRPAAGEPGADSRRRYFEITPAGRRALAAEIRRLDDLVAVARSRRLYRPGR